MSKTVSWIITVGLVCLSGLFSGLNLGLMSFAEEDLNVIIRGSADPQEVKDAEKILPIRKRGNFLLCTLLLGNTLVNAFLAILMGDLLAGFVGGLVASGFIVVFGEIIPQSVCSRYGLRIGAMSVPVVVFFMIAVGVIAYPISLLLDYVLGQEVSGTYSRDEFMEMIKINKTRELGIDDEEVGIVKGALSWSKKLVEEVMTKADACYILDESTILHKDTMTEILSKGHTRIPVHRKGENKEIFAILYAKDLIGIGFERNEPLTEVLKAFGAKHRVHKWNKSKPLKTAFQYCQTNRVHLLVVTDEVGNFEGLLSMEDMIEEIIAQEIVDDDDVVDDQGKVSAGTEGVANANTKKYDPARLIHQLSTQPPKENNPPAPAEGGGLLFCE